MLPTNPNVGPLQGPAFNPDSDQILSVEEQSKMMAKHHEAIMDVLNRNNGLLDMILEFDKEAEDRRNRQRLQDREADLEARRKAMAAVPAGGVTTATAADSGPGLLGGIMSGIAGILPEALAAGLGLAGLKKALSSNTTAVNKNSKATNKRVNQVNESKKTNRQVGPPGTGGPQSKLKPGSINPKTGNIVGADGKDTAVKGTDPKAKDVQKQIRASDQAKQTTAELKKATPKKPPSGFMKALGKARGAGLIGAAVNVLLLGYDLSVISDMEKEGAFDGEDEVANAKQADIKKAEAVGGASGAAAGAAIGAAVGSVVPIVGTAIGGIAGGILGYLGGGELGGAVEAGTDVEGGIVDSAFSKFKSVFGFGGGGEETKEKPAPEMPDESSTEIPEGLSMGGRVESGRDFIVGEQGPEMFIPDSSGSIIPNPLSRSLGAGEQANVLKFAADLLGGAKDDLAEKFSGTSFGKFIDDIDIPAIPPARRTDTAAAAVTQMASAQASEPTVAAPTVIAPNNVSTSNIQNSYMVAPVFPKNRDESFNRISDNAYSYG